MFAEMIRRPYGFLLLAAAIAALLCLFPVRTQEEPDGENTALQMTEAGMAAGADLAARTGDHCMLHRTTMYLPCGHSVQQRVQLPAQLRGLTRGALDQAIGGVLPGAKVTGFSADEVDVTIGAEIPCPLHWVLADGEDGMLHVLQNRTGDTLSPVRDTDVPVSRVPQEERAQLERGRVFDDVQELERYLESLSS
ncbi:MAG: hypothetical protein J6K32_11010 [Clostridia bacterium]|nr:hypothetical protein [Clostridia bacterium]